MNGILLIHKPQEFTSFDVIAKLRGILKTKKIGHAGTLDPMATGVLPVFVGSATKACSLLQDTDKTYIATLRLGITTDTQDIWGKVIATQKVAVTPQQFTDAAMRFTGDLSQLPPMFSAVKIGGKKLYELARQGTEIERPLRNILIYSLRVLCCDEENAEYTIEVCCSKGTYIRTLCNDIGEILGCGAVMSALVRTKAAGFLLDECLTLGEVQSLMDSGELASRLIPVEKIFNNLQSVHLTANDTARFLNGVKLDIQELGLTYTENDLKIYTNDGVFLGLGYIEDGAKVLRVRRFFARQDT